MVNSKKEKEEEEDSFEELVDKISDLPVHEEFVTNKKLRILKDKRIRKS